MLTLLLAGMLAFGLLLFGANVLQQAADVGAQELARTPLPPDMEFEQALVASGLYDEAALVVEPGTDPATLPLINRLLYPLYIYDAGIGMARYPGALAENADGERTVLIPIVAERDPESGAETIGEWRRVVEEILTPAADGNGEGVGPFGLVSDAPDAGVVALRINYPYQAGSLVAYQYEIDGEIVTGQEALGQRVRNRPVIADDGSVVDAALLPDGYTLAGGDSDLPPPYAGEYGLGRMQAWTATVRPFRRVLSAQGIYRREVFGPAAPPPAEEADPGE